MPAPARTAAYTHRGRRRSNQDAVIASRLTDGRELVALADGMGGQAAGEVASARALEVLVEELETGTSLEDAVRAANTAVHMEAHGSAEHEGMGTTLVALLRTGNTYRVANVGDSRAYRIADGAIEQITRDHSFVADALRSGTLSPAEAEVSPWRHALTRAIGTDPAVEVDLFGPFDVGSAHAVLLCSDGLYKALPDGTIADFVWSSEDIEAAVRGLSALAFREGSDDNISAVGVEFGRLSRRLPMVTAPLSIERQLEQHRPEAPAATPAARPPAPAPAKPAGLAGAATKRQGRGSHPAARVVLVVVLMSLGVAAVAWALLRS
jgi:protein phosphatase